MRLSKLLPIIGIVLFIYIVLTNNPATIWASFLTINPAFLVISIILAFITLFLKGLKWKAIIKLHGMDYPLSSSIKVWSTGLFAGIVTPGRIGDFIRAFYLKRGGGSLGRSLSTVIVDRIIDMVVVLVFALAGIVMMNYWFGSSIISIGLLSVLIIACLVLLYLITKRDFMRIILKPVFRFFVPSKHKEGARVGFHEFYGSIGCLRNRKDGLLVVSLFTVIIWLFSIFQVYMIGLTIGIVFDYVFLLAVMSIVVIIELIPISVSGLGTREAFMILALSLAGIASGTATAFSLLYMILAYWSLAVVGLVFWLNDPVEISLSS